MSRRSLIQTLAFACCLGSALADPLSRKVDVDFFRDVPSRNLKGLATRSDGRLVGGPTLTELSGQAPADLLWCIALTDDPRKFLVGTGPDGRIVELTLTPTGDGFASRDVAKLQDPQVFSVLRLADGSILAGTSPKGGLYLIRDGKPIARVPLPVDSIFDLLPLDNDTVLAATGNPARIYRIDLRRFAAAGIVAEKIADQRILGERGITLFGEVRDRNLRRIAALPDGRIVAGSAPKGNIYAFPPAGGSPVVLQENRDAEVTDLLTQPDGDLYATIVFSSTTGDTRVASSNPRGNNAAKDRDQRDQTQSDAPPPPVQPERFGGRSSLVWFPANRFPETLTTRNNAAFYRMSRRGDTLVIAGGDAGEILGFDLRSRLALTFAGSASAQVNGILQLPGGTDRFLLLRNNAPGVGILDFGASGVREAETRRIDLGPTPAILGAVRFNRLRAVAPADLSLEAQVNNGTDEVEGWSPWSRLALGMDEGWRGNNLQGRSAKLRIRLPSTGSPAAEPQLDRAALYVLPQNRRPQLQEFRVLSPGYGIVVATDSPRSPVVSLNQLLQGARDDEKRRETFNSSQVVPQPGAQVVLWTVSDPDGDALSCTFSLRRDGDDKWIDVVTDTRDSYAQFDTTNLPDGIYFTRLVANETAPRPVADRLSQTFETDDLVIDHTPPEILDASARRNGDTVTVSIHGRDLLSLLDGAEFVFSNGVRQIVEQPKDGIRDGREETFVLDLPVAQVSNATSVEVNLYDAAGNNVSRRLKW